mgnify:CR=1 FL=1
MKSLFVVAKERVQEVLDSEHIYDFPTLIKKVREATGLAQCYVIKETKLMYLSFFESEKRFKEPTDRDLITLAKYYEVPLHLLIAKKNKFMRTQ